MQKEAEYGVCAHWSYKEGVDLRKENKNPLILESKDPTVPLQDYAYGENRYKMLQKINPEAAAKLMKQAEEDVAMRFKLYKQLSQLECNKEESK